MTTMIGGTRTLISRKGGVFIEVARNSSNFGGGIAFGSNAAGIKLGIRTTSSGLATIKNARTLAKRCNSSSSTHRQYVVSYKNNSLQMRHCNNNQPCRFSHSGNNGTTATAEKSSSSSAQQRAYDYYRKKHGASSSSSSSSSTHERNVKIASYAAAAVIGALGATYASVPLYKIFCQTTGFGGTTQRVSLPEWAEQTEAREKSGKSKVSQALWDKLVTLSNVPSEMLPSKPGASHGRGGPKTWTDEEAAAKLASLKPVKDGRLITVRFDSTVGDVMPWSFTPTQLDVKVVPGETALSFFTATNHHPDKAITGVATYNVHPPKAGLYFNKIQCFCFEEQRLLPGETVDMPVFFFIDPEYADDPQLSTVNNITLSYTFFQTDMDDEDDDDDDDDEEEEEKKAA